MNDSYISRGQFFGPIFWSQKVNLYTSKYGTPHTYELSSSIDTEAKFKEMDLLIADSLFLIRHLLKENKQVERFQMKTFGTSTNVHFPSWL